MGMKPFLNMNLWKGWQKKENLCPIFIKVFGNVWIINERTALIVSYSNKDKVVVCGFSTEENLNPIVNIVDRTKTEGFPYDMAEEKFLKMVTTNTISVGYTAIMSLFTMRMAVKKI